MNNHSLTILDIIEGTAVDGPGLRTTVYAAGCRHHCRGCHNPLSWDIKNGHSIPVEQLAHRLLSNPFADITFSGGDPLEQVEAFTALAIKIKNRSRKTIWCYTGYTFEEICRSSRLSQILPHIDVLVDGRYVQNLRDTDLLFRGSSNQRLIDVKRSIETNTPCSYHYAPFPILAV